MNDQIDTINSEQDSKSSLGFWIYLMTDLILFSSFFAVFAVLRNNTFGGHAGRELFSISFVLTETLILLTSSFACGIAVLHARSGDKIRALTWLSLTFMLGIVFLGMEISEFSKLVSEGNSWSRSGFLTSFFSLVGLHGLHIAIGLFWLLTVLIIIIKKGLINSTIKRLTMFGIFWHFLDIVWIFIFTIVYLLGAIQ